MIGKTNHFSNPEIADEITDSNGILSVAVRKIGCSRQTIYNHLKKSKKLLEICNNEKESMIDFAEMKIFENIQAGKEASFTIF